MKGKYMASTNKNTAVAHEKSVVKVVKELDPSMVVSVKNGFDGTLVYHSKKTGEDFVWHALGDEQDIDLAELKNARNASKSFFENNWFVIDDEDVLKWLRVDSFYENALTIEEMETIEEQPAAKITKMISGMSNGQRETLRYMIIRKHAEGKLDGATVKSLKVLEKLLNINLIGEED